MFQALCPRCSSRLIPSPHIMFFTPRRSLLIGSVVALLALLLPQITHSPLLPQKLDVRQVTKDVIGRWEPKNGRTDSSLFFFENGTCAWGKSKPEPCEFYDAEHLPAFFHSVPRAGAVYFVSGALDAPKPFVVIRQSAKELVLEQLPEENFLTYVRR